MNINEFQTLPREEQLAEAGRIAGVAPSVFDGIWRTESGRGAEMLSPKGAKGHFGLMDATRTTWEKRFGASIDPMDFGQSLFTSAHTLKENIGRFKTLNNGLRAYNSGWDPAKWGNKETAGYVGKVLGSDMDDADDTPDAAGEPAGAAAVAGVVPQAADLWTVPSAAKPLPAAKTGGKFAKVAAAGAVAESLTTPVTTPDFGLVNAGVIGAIVEQDAALKLAKDTSFLDAARAASNGLLLNQTAALVFRDAEPIDPNFVVPEDVMKGKTEVQMRQLRNAGSRKELDRLLFEHQDEKDQNEIVFANGAVFGMGATLLADLPAAAISGGAISFGLKAAGMGSFALAAQGFKLKAIASATAEGIAGNVVYTAALDAMGVHQGAEQYAIAVAGGLLNPLLSGRSLGRAADRALEAKTAIRIFEEAKVKQLALAEQAQKNLGAKATADELGVEMSRIEAEGIRAEMTSHTAAIPESRKMNFGDEALEEAPVEGKPVTPVEAKAPEAAAPVEPVAAAPVEPVVPHPTVKPINVDEYKPVLPEGLQGAKPKYAFGSKQFGLQFESEVDLAAYIVAGAKKSKSDAKYMDWLEKEVGFTPEEARAHGARVRERIKTQAILGDGDSLIVSAEKTPQGWGSTGSEVRKGFDDVNEARAELGNDVAPKWESKDFQQNRVMTAERNPEFTGMVKTFANGEVDWAGIKNLSQGTHTTAALREVMTTNLGLKRDVAALESLIREYLPDSKVVIGTGTPANTNGAVISAGRTHVIALSTRPGARMHTAMHELGHAIYHQHAAGAPTELLKRIDADWLAFVNKARGMDFDAWNQRYAATSGRAQTARGRNPDSAYDLSRDEYMAEQFVKHIHNRMLSGAYGKLPKSTIDRVLMGVRAVMDFVRTLVKGGMMKPGAGADEFFSTVLKGAEAKLAKADAAMPAEMRNPTMAESGQIASMDVRSEKIAADATAHMNDPIARKYGLDMLPMGSTAERAEAKQILAAYTRADAWSTANPIDENRLNKLLKNSPFDPSSNVMLRSKNPVVRMIASELLENGGGASGRRSTAAIAKYMNERAIIGNVVNDLDTHFHAWHNKQPGADRAKEFLTDKKRVEFNRLIAEEVEQRRYPGAQVDLGDAVRAAADSMEGSFERARLMQQDAKTIGWGALPESSRGYMPHRMKADTVRSMTPVQRRALHSAITDQFIEISKFDMTFADDLASKYLDRVNARALGGFDAPAGIHQTGAHEVVKEALEQMGMNRAEIDATMKRYVAGGAQHTKKRLDFDLRQKFTNEDGTTFRLMDLFDTDMLSLVRGQSQRVSGEVALARHGIMGKPGLAIARRAMMAAGHLTQKVEIDSFDQAAAEFLGAPFGTQNKWVDRAMQANSVASLGGMGFNQLGEIINVATTLGVKSAFSVVKDFGRLRAELLALAKGKVVDNKIVGSLEKFGGAQFGTDAYKMVFPMDMPDAPIHTMGADGIAAGDKLLRGAGHVQSSLSMWRAITSVQQRGVAEQAVHSIAKALRDNKGSMTLADMGISDDVLRRLQADMPNMTKWDGDKLIEFDITKATDIDAANQLVQGVHRGVSQMIQGTFIGESGKYVHNSYLRMLTQFRNFSLTAIDKQWNRQKGNRGVAAALGMTVGAMSAAAPIYMVRTFLASVGRDDQAEYLEKRLGWGSVARATTNYIATSGLAGDFLDVFTSVTGTGEATGGRSGATTTLVGNLVAPALGKVDKVWGALQNTKDGTDVHGLIREGPLARLPFLIPAVNALGN